MTDAVLESRTIDVSALPTLAFSHRSLMWWGILGLMAIESTVFALTVVTYFYLRSHADNWPLTAPPPVLLWGTLNTVVMLVSLLPNHLAKRAAERLDLQGVRLWLWVGIAIGVVFLVLRVFEFAGLNTRWDSNAYGSVVWLLLGFHTTHLLTDVFDSVVLGVLFFTGPLEAKRFTDVSENAFYWYFVVFSWLPIYLVIYWGARAT
ncbi:cytochrome c oxidase subunit 3 [Ramlibacter sp. MMS24-I3-19]|uniref:cytochrome c oxidase subunit 3 n=1 Tax=Ramlibacter sp. MMS24-I3-19 TaxID=3416606 RepID=UPI003CFCBB36